jgi:hypothetical protein
MACMERILPNPPGPSIFRVCEGCRRWFALQLQVKKPDRIAGTLSTYKCKHCGVTVTYAAEHPSSAV